ncbi:hypothetical protein HB825_04915 [Listeria booriae]|uniref:hypothetical protein n=1 Tax=Listeria booriae TaxID=1552123 RepID=UPI00164D83F9|nr:hypothetical protein [Listeria booriae]MBC6134177.1 hypothetical protein [Listeria booriae]
MKDSLKKVIIGILTVTLVFSGMVLLPSKADAAPVTRWETTKTYTNMAYGSWETQGVRKKSSSTGKVSFSVSTKVSTSYSGTIKVGIPKVESVLGFKLSSSATYKFTNTWDVKKNVTYKVQTRKRYKVYSVKQSKITTDSWTGQRTVSNYYVTVKKNDGIDVRALEY